MPRTTTLYIETVRGDRAEREDLGEDEMGLKGFGRDAEGLDLFELLHGFA